ncbi:MAG TPA: aminotransferase class V-fold PLP-dependent enzyme [Nannocystis sp.]
MTSDTPIARLGDRSLFPDLQPRAYLNHAAVSPWSSPVRAAVEAVARDYAHYGAGAILPWIAQRSRLRATIAGLIGAEPNDIALISNTTRGVTDVALCMSWKPGDRVLLFQGEFPANVTPWQQAAELFGLSIEMLPLEDFARSHAEGLAVLRAALQQSPVRLVAVSAVQFQSGLRMPLAAMADLCHEAGAVLFVDGIQAVGAVPLDVRGARVDFLAVGGHKWMMGCEGLGFLYVRPERLAELRPRVAGWLSHEDGLRFLLEGAGHLRYDRPIRRRADFVEGGATSTVGCAALEAALGLITQLGPAEIFAHVQAYLDALEAGLVDRGFVSLRAREPAARSCILSVLPPNPGDVLGLQRELAERGVACSTPDGLLRFAPHWPNHIDEVPFVLAAVDAALGHG